MAGNLKKFVNPRFIKTIDLVLMKALLARHEGKFNDFSVDLLDQEEDAAREALDNLLTGAEDSIIRKVCEPISTGLPSWATGVASKSSRPRPTVRASICFRT